MSDSTSRVENVIRIKGGIVSEKECLNVIKEYIKRHAKDDVRLKLIRIFNSVRDIPETRDRFIRRALRLTVRYCDDRYFKLCVAICDYVFILRNIVEECTDPKPYRHSKLWMDVLTPIIIRTNRTVIISRLIPTELSEKKHYSIALGHIIIMTINMDNHELLHHLLQKMYPKRNPAVDEYVKKFLPLYTIPLSDQMRSVLKKNGFLEDLYLDYDSDTYDDNDELGYQTDIIQELTTEQLLRGYE